MRPTELVLDGALRVNGPNRAAVEKDRAAGESDEKVRVSGEAYRNVPLGIAASIDDVVGGECILEAVGYLGRRVDNGTAAIYSGISALCCATTSFSFSLRTGVCCLVFAVVCLPLPCHGTFKTFAIAGHNSVVAVAI